jgi:hypothetical protein
MLVQTDRTPPPPPPPPPPPKTSLEPPAALQQVNKIKKKVQDQQGINLVCALSAVGPRTAVLLCFCCCIFLTCIFLCFLIKKNSQSGAYSLYSSTAANRGPVYLVGSLSRDRLEVRLGMDIVMIHLRTFLAFNVTR